MIALQHLDSFEPLQAIEIDLAVLDLKTKLKTNLAWLSNSYGRAYRLDKMGKDEKKLVLPSVYVGNTDGKYSLVPVTPDNDKKAISYFAIDKERVLNFASNEQNFITWNVGLVFWVNLELINKDWAKNEDFTQVLIKQTRDVITNNLLGMGYRCEIVDVEREVNQVFREYILQDRQYVIMPFSAFRFNLNITLREDCKLPIDRQQAILNNVTTMEIQNYIIPKLDFSGNDFLFLSDEQKEQLTLRLNL